MTRALRLHPEFGRCDSCGYEAALWLDLCADCWATIYAPPRPTRRTWLDAMVLPKVREWGRVADAWEGWPTLLALGAFTFVVLLYLTGGTR